MTKFLNFVLFVSSFENTCEGMICTRACGAPSYPRKRVSRLIRRTTNLDSRVRGNDESRSGACSGNANYFHASKAIHGYFVVNDYFSGRRGSRARISVPLR